MPDPIEVAKKSKNKKKKDYFVDPEIVRQRREEKAKAKWEAAQAFEEAKARGEIPAEKPRFLVREFITIPHKSTSSANGHADRLTISIMTWNVRTHKARATPTLI